MPLVPPLNLASLDPQNFVGADLFGFVLGHEVRKATRLRYALSILCLTPDLPSADATPGVVQQLSRVATSQLRATDLGSALPPVSVTLLLIDAELRNLPGILERLRAALEPLSLPALPKVQPLTLSAGGGCYPQTATTGSELLQQALDLMSRAKAEGGNRLYLPG